MSERYVNPRLKSGLAHVFANSFDEGNHLRVWSFVWYEHEFSMCKTKAFRRLYEARALAVFRSLDKSLTDGKTVRMAWTPHGELVITPDFLPKR